MGKWPLLWHLFPAHLFIALFSVGAVTWYCTVSIRPFYLEKTEAALFSQARLAERTLLPLLVQAEGSPPAAMDRLCKDMGQTAQIRVTFIRPDGAVACDSHEDPDRMENHHDRPEVLQAQKTGRGASVRLSKTLGHKSMYVAIPLWDHGRLLGTLRTSLPVSSIDAALQEIQMQVALGGLAIALLAAGISFVLARRLSRPLMQMTHSAERFARGEMGQPLGASGTREMNRLAQALADMAAQLDERMQALAQQKNLAEDMRREFVANVSHELRTPLTAIRGGVETLKGGAMEKPELRGRFLDMIDRQSNRMAFIIDDLLLLSRIEEDERRREVTLEQVNLDELLRLAVLDCEHAARERNIRLHTQVESHLTARLNPHLITQALVNLITNAIKYTDPGGQVAIAAQRQGAELVLSVQDWGSGIDPADQPRLFERFYRVDKARSRKQGGTGLGLAIVKHIAQVHGGQVTVSSQLGQGAVFAMILPQDAA